MVCTNCRQIDMKQVLKYSALMAGKSSFSSNPMSILSEDIEAVRTATVRATFSPVISNDKCFGWLRGTIHHEAPRHDVVFVASVFACEKYV